MFGKLALASALAGLVASAPISTESHTEETFGDFSVSFWYDGSYTGSCGFTNSTKQYIASIRNVNATLDSACGRTINITDAKNHHSVLAMVVDEVVDAPRNYLNVSRVAFQQVTNLDDTLFNASYVFVDAPVPEWTAPADNNRNNNAGSVPASSPKKQEPSPRPQSTPQSSSRSSPQSSQSSSSRASPQAQAAASPSPREEQEQEEKQEQRPQRPQQQQSSSSSRRVEQERPTSSSRHVEQPKYTPRTTTTSSSRKQEYTPRTTTSSSKKQEYTPRTTTSSSRKQEHTPQKEEYTPRTTSKKADPTPAKSSGGGGQFSGRGTWYTQNGNAGACGSVNSDGAYIVALNSAQYAGGSHCGQSVRISAGGRSITARVADLCPGCPYGGLDLSTGAFQALGSLGQGVLSLSWSWA